jgi:Type IX secretion system protein PorV
MKKIIFLLNLLLAVILHAQSLNPILTAFPSLRIPASSRGLAMGDCGIASASENQQLYYNPAKTAFTSNFHQASVSYLPWATAISDESRFLNANYLANLSNTSSLGLAISYLNLGKLDVRDDNGATLASYTAREYNLSANFALQLAGNQSLGVSLRFLGSQPVQAIPINGFALGGKNIFSVASDLSYYGYRTFGSSGSKLEWGAVISNLGPKVGLDAFAQKTNLPTNLGLGLAYTQMNPGSTDQFIFAMDINKLLVPTPGGKHPDATVLQSLFTSFTDAAASEELSEIRVSTGMEYGFADQFFLRGGLSLENRLKGNRKFLGLGVGYKGTLMDQSWGIDFHYLVPVGNLVAISPFQQSFGFTLKFGIGNFD